MFKRLRVRLTLICTVITGIILAGMAAGALTIANSQQAKNSAVAFQSDYNSIIYHIQSQTVLDRSWLAQTENGNRLVIHIEDNGIPLLYNGTWKTQTQRETLIKTAKEAAALQSFDLGAPPITGLSADSLFYMIYGEEGERYRAAAANVPTPLGWVVLVLLKDMRAEDSQSLLQSRMFLGLVLVGMLFLFLFSFWFTGRAVRPIEQSALRQTQFVAAASHELRTPLAVIQTSSSAILKATPEQAQRFVTSIGQECGRMARLVDDLLLLARADAKTWSIQRSLVEMDTLLLRISELFEPVAAQKKISLSVILEEDEALPPVLGDEQRLSQVLSILLDNAICYTPQGGSITLSACCGGGGIRISVVDSGPGVSPEAKSRIFERFYRAENARTEKEHYGLGLSIAQEIVELHKGSIWVLNNPLPPGCTFFVELPVQPDKMLKPQH